MQYQPSMNGAQAIIAAGMSLNVLLLTQEPLNIGFATLERNESQSDMS
jgi:hypothetical protein